MTGAAGVGLESSLAGRCPMEGRAWLGCKSLVFLFKNLEPGDLYREKIMVHVFCA